MFCFIQTDFLMFSSSDKHPVFQCFPEKVDINAALDLMMQVRHLYVFNPDSFVMTGAAVLLFKTFIVKLQKFAGYAF